MIEISRIKTDGGTQPRVSLNQETVAEYRDAYKSGVKLPPVTLFFDGTSYWLADGFHRFWAARDAGLTEIYEDIQPGTLRDAILYSLSANAKHGLRRTNADKRKAVQTLLDDAEWSKFSDREIAKRCAVGYDLVADMRKSHLPETIDRRKSHLPETIDRPQADTRTVQRNGTTYQQRTANIGKQKPAEPGPEPEPAEPTEPEYTPLDEAMDTIKDLQDALALANAGYLAESDRSQAADLIAQLREENRILTLRLQAVTAARDGFMQQVAELKKQCAMQRKELAKR